MHDCETGVNQKCESGSLSALVLRGIVLEFRLLGTPGEVLQAPAVRVGGGVSRRKELFSSQASRELREGERPRQFHSMY